MLLCSSICSSSLLNRSKYLKSQKMIRVIKFVYLADISSLKQSLAFACPLNFCIPPSSGPQTSALPRITRPFPKSLPVIKVSVKLRIFVSGHLLDVSIWMSRRGFTQQNRVGPYPCPHPSPTEPALSSAPYLSKQYDHSSSCPNEECKCPSWFLSLPFTPRLRFHWRLRRLPSSQLCNPFLFITLLLTKQRQPASLSWITASASQWRPGQSHAPWDHNSHSRYYDLSKV